MSVDWIRDRIVAALEKVSDDAVQKQADAIMRLLEETAREPDTYHAFVGYLNTLRLEGESERMADLFREAREREDG
jgi:hypothetical protein